MKMDYPLAAYIAWAAVSFFVVVAVLVISSQANTIKQLQNQLAVERLIARSGSVHFLGGGGGGIRKFVPEAKKCSLYFFGGSRFIGTNSAPLNSTAKVKK